MPASRSPHHGALQPPGGARQHGRPRRLVRYVLFLAALLWLLVPAVASAHAHLVQANPAPDSIIAHAPSVAEFIFDEPLNPALTRVRITTASGRQVTTNTGHLAAGHNGELWEVPLPSLPAGTYSVFWTSESATDGHVISSFYTFRVAPSGSAGGIGTVTGTAAGTYGGGGTGSAAGLGIGAGAFATAFLTWLGLMAGALWLGALIVELAVLAPARRAVDTPEARLAWAAAARLWWLVRGALVVAVWALAGEVVSLAVQGTGGDWGRALAPDTLGGIFSSQNGRFTLLRFAALLLALLLVGAARAAAPSTGRARAQVRRSPQALGIVAPAFTPRPAQPRGPLTRGSLSRGALTRGTLTLLAAIYMLLVAFSGHAADVTPGWLSYPIDWLHLICTAAWAGGIAALAYGVVPLRRVLPAGERAPALLPLLDRFSPVAYIAVGVLALSGLYNAVNHLSSPVMLGDTTYGQLLVLKLGLVGLLILLSATHVHLLRPRLLRLTGALSPEASGGTHPAALDRRSEGAATGRVKRHGHTPTGGTGAVGTAVGTVADVAAGIHEGLATLAARLRLETAVGAAILLVTALMGQTLPPASVSTVTATPATPTTISGTATLADLRAQLTVAPPAVGATTFTLYVWEQGKALTANDAAAIIHLYPAARPTLRANLTPQAHGTRFTVRGSLATTGTWRADVLVRTAIVNTYRTLHFTFTVGPGAAFLAPGLNPAAITIAVSPGRISGPNTFTIGGVRGVSAVRLLSQSLDMNMGILPYKATALGGGRWRVSGAYAPMNGRWGLTVQAQESGGWVSLRQFVYEVPLSGPMRLLTPQGAPSPTAAPGKSGTGTGATGPATAPPGAANHRLSGPFNVAFARTLPYTVLVTEMGSNGVRLLGGPLLHTGLQAHGVDVLDGTPYAYVTNFGAEPGTVSQIDLRTMRVVRTFAVGLGPAHVVFTPDHSYAFVTDFRSSDLYRIDLRSGATRQIPLNNCFEPHGLDISEDARTLYVACAGGAWIYTVSTATLRQGKAVITGRGAFGVAVDGPRHEVWVTNQTDNDVSVLDERTLRVLATIRVGTGPALLVPTPDGRRVYVADQFGNKVSVIDAASRRVIATLPVAAQPHGPDVTADGKYVYVASIGGNAVTIIRTSDNRVVAIVPSSVGSNEVAVAH